MIYLDFSPDSGEDLQWKMKLISKGKRFAAKRAPQSVNDLFFFCLFCFLINTEKACLIFSKHKTILIKIVTSVE